MAPGPGPSGSTLVYINVVSLCQHGILHPHPHPASGSQHLAEQMSIVLIKPVLPDCGAMWDALGALVPEPIAWGSQEGSPGAQRPGPAAGKSPLFLGFIIQSPHS